MFKKLGVEDGRRNRQNVSIAIRKNKAYNQIQSRRRVDTIADAVESAITPNNAVIAETKTSPDLGSAILDIYSPVQSQVYEAAVKIRKFLSIQKSPPIQVIVNTGVVPRLVELLKQEESTEIQFESAWALTNIASGTSTDTKLVVECGSIPVFVHLLKSPNINVREQALWALGNITGDCIQYRDMVLQLGGITDLLDILQNHTHYKTSLIRNGAWALSNFCRGHPTPDIQFVLPTIPVLCTLIQYPDSDVVTDVCWTLSYLTTGPPDVAQIIMDSGIYGFIVTLLGYNNENVQIGALRTVGNIVAGTDEQTEILMIYGLLPKLLDLIGSRNKTLVKESCWALSNITAGTKSQIQQVIDTGVFSRLCMLQQSPNFEIRKEASHVMHKALTGGTPEQIVQIVKSGCIPVLCHNLYENDVELQMLALDSLWFVLDVGRILVGDPNAYCEYFEEFGGIDHLENLTISDNPDVARKAISIIDTYFGEEE